MKEFRKDDKGNFVCEECKRLFINCSALSKHIGAYHLKKEYYDNWLKEENEGICKNCNKQTKFINRLNQGYQKCCCKKCTNKNRQIQVEKGCFKKYGTKCSLQSEDVKNKIKETCKEKYGVEYSLQSKEIRNKGKETCKEKYGDENYHNMEKIKQTNLERYGVENVFQSQKIINRCEQAHFQNLGVKNPFQSDKIKKKIKETNLKNLGVEYPMQSKNVQEKSKQTCLEKYGVEYTSQSENTKEKSKRTSLKNYGTEHPNQNQEQFNKGLKTRLLIHKYKDTNLTYQGSYEYHFLELCEKLNILDKIQNGLSFNYKLNGKNKVYHSDFFISSLNLVVEIKNSYLYNKDKEEILAKEKATIANGFNYIMIIDKDYDKFNKKVLES